ncbi:uncharacterized protein [Montipora capricornis]|uniref:uncharacterized protein n=1 Tax=Montipora capricornis TaxID=246305 RepID=UPI0035F1E4E6
MTGFYYVVIMLVCGLIHNGFSRNCYQCGFLNGTNPSSVECQDLQTIETCSDEDYVCANLTITTTNNNNNNTKVEEAKRCLSQDDYEALANTCDEVRNSETECNFSYCQQDLCNDDVDPGTLLKCYQCHGPFANPSVALEQQLTLHESYTTRQCHDERRIVAHARLNATCGKLFRRQMNVENLTVAVSLSFLLSGESECKELDEMCRELRQNGTNPTEECDVFCCKMDLCNKATGLNFIPFLSVLSLVLPVFQW